MALIVRIDVDRPYGKQGFLRHVASRVSSDFFLPRMTWMRYLNELKTILRILNSQNKQAFVFFRKCTYPTQEVLELMKAGGHRLGLHLENSRSAETFCEELRSLEQKVGRPIDAFSKHGSGQARYGRRHYAPYEFEKYVEWGGKTGMRLLFGNLEDPRLTPFQHGDLLCFPSAFWLEPAWRDTRAFPIDWLLQEAGQRDVVMLLHPDNVTASADLMQDFQTVIGALDTTVLARSCYAPRAAQVISVT